MAAQQKKGTGEPNVALLLTWFIPGAGHVYLGRMGFGVAAFVVVHGLYLLGLNLSAGMTWEFLDPELRSRFAPALAPELGNMGGFLWQMNRYAFGPGFPRVWPETIRLGTTLCALSGVLNIILMVQAHLEARRGAPKGLGFDKPTRVVFLAWLVPGLGHFVQGRRKRAWIVFALLVGLFAAGTLLAEGSNLSRERHYYYWGGQFMIGLPGLLSEWAFGGMRIREEIPYVDAGLVFGCVAGLLNILVMIDAYGYSEAKLFGWPTRSASAARAAAEESSGDGKSSPAGGERADKAEAKPTEATS